MCSFHVNHWLFALSCPDPPLEGNSMPSALTAGSSSSQQKQHSSVLWLCWRSLTPSVTLKPPHPSPAACCDCPFPWWGQVSPHRCSSFPLLSISLPSLPQKGGSGQDNLQWLCPVCTWSNQNYHRRKGFQLSQFIDTHVMNLSVLTVVYFLIWILWIMRICDC